MIRLKPGVRIDRLRPQMLLALHNAAELWSMFAHLPDVVITSGNEGQHVAGSKHYEGLAVDLRTHQLSDPAKLVRLLGQSLGPDFQVLLENQDTPFQHCHVEYDPRRGEMGPALATAPPTQPPTRQG